MGSRKRIGWRLALGLSVLLGGPGCLSAYKSSVGVDQDPIYHRIYRTEFDIAWQSVLESLKSMRLDISNREGGFVQTKWTDNTGERNLIESYGSASDRAYIKAQYRYKVWVARGYFDGVQAVKVAVQKEQLAQSDALEAMRPRPSDSIEENTLLYRIGRLVYLRIKQQRAEDRKAQEAIQEVPTVN